MKKVDTKHSVEKIVVNGLLVNQWEKVCPVCKKPYKTTSRSQKFCCTACALKYNRKRNASKRVYNSQKELNRLYSRAHALGVEVLTQLEELNLIQHECRICKSTEELQCHHISIDYLDNRPSNVVWLCTKCHSQVHSTNPPQFDSYAIDSTSLQPK